MPQSAQTRRRLFWLTWLMTATTVVAIVCSILLIVTRATQACTAADVADYQACQAVYQQGFATACTTARADANVASQRAADRIFGAVVARDRDALDAATRHYLRVRAAQTRQQDAHPLRHCRRRCVGSRLRVSVDGGTPRRSAGSLP